MARLSKKEKEAQKMRELTEKQRISKAKLLVAEKNKKTVKVLFRNIESPGVDVPFNHLGFPYHLFDGMEYDLPVHVINHLNNLSRPQREYVLDAKSGQKVSKIVGRINRFSIQPVNLEEAVGA